MRYLILCFLFLSQLKLGAFEISKMTLEEKVGQLFMVYFDGEDANENAQRLIEEARIGGIVFYNWANGLENPKQVQELCAGLQSLAIGSSGVPLLIAADQEGGLVARLEKGFTEFPGNAALGRTGEPSLAFEAAEYIGKEISSVGVNFNLSPVVDVNNNPKNPIIGIRAYGDEPEMVTRFGRASINGYKKAGVIPCLKHFPGHGDVTVDSHKGLPIVSKPLSQLLNCELYPYVNLVNDAPAIMTAHILFPQIDPNNCATLSPIILNDILREQLGFQGVLVTDSLTMQGVLEGHDNLEQVIFKAIAAGNDILLIGGRDLQNKMDGETHIDEVIRIFKNVVHAVRIGKIKESRIDESVARILDLKKNTIRVDGTFTSKKMREELQSDEHLRLAREIAYRSLSIQSWDFEGDLTSKRILLIAPKVIQAKLTDSSLNSISESVATYFFNGLEPPAQESEEILHKLQDVDVAIFCSYNAWKIPIQCELLNQVAAKIPTVCVAVRDPYDLDIQNQAIIKMATYSPTKCAFQVVAEWLQENTMPLEITDTQAQNISQKIWYNECKHRVDQLTFWNAKEPFPSIGIGHFIWPPESYQGPFKGGRFHKFIEYARTQGEDVPSWLVNQRYCPWSTRDDFYHAFDSLKMKELRDFLVGSVALQAKFMVHRLNQAFREIVLTAPFQERQAIINNFFSVGKSKNGLYILVDYLNFKHEGTNLKERYNGEGWGLLQVLQEMDKNATPSPERAFADAAKFVLSRRVGNSPNHTVETTWIPVWFERLDSYCNTTD